MMSNSIKEHMENMKQFVKDVASDENAALLRQIMYNWIDAGMAPNDVVVQGHNFALTMAEEVYNGEPKYIFEKTAIIQAASYLLKKAGQMEKDKLESIRHAMHHKTEKSDNEQ